MDSHSPSPPLQPEPRLLSVSGRSPASCPLEARAPPPVRQQPEPRLLSVSGLSSASCPSAAGVPPPVRQQRPELCLLSVSSGLRCSQKHEPVNCACACFPHLHAFQIVFQEHGPWCPKGWGSRPQGFQQEAALSAVWFWPKTADLQDRARTPAVQSRELALTAARANPSSGEDRVARGEHALRPTPSGSQHQGHRYVVVNRRASTPTGDPFYITRPCNHHAAHLTLTRYLTSTLNVQQKLLQKEKPLRAQT